MTATLETKTTTEYEAVIGLETHIQLQTESKMFCGCSAEYANAAPNTHVCQVCLGMPGVLPVINEKAIEYITMFGYALHCEIPEYSKFDRKNYFYPDLVKGYQISQFDLPICINGWVDIEVDGQTRRIGVTRVHQEEDTGKLTHVNSSEGENYTLVDYNRSGVPLMEGVSEPDMRTADEAAAYLTKIRQIIRWLGIGTANMDEGAMRCDANVSVRPKGTSTFGTKIEIKNMNSIRSVHDAINYEIQRQIQEIEAGKTLAQQTRGWDEDKQVTVFQRFKEGSSDYRYFPEPDLPPLRLAQDWRDNVKAKMPEMSEDRRERFVNDFGLSKYDSEVLTASRATADYFEEALGSEKTAARAKSVANWLLNELFGRLKENDQDLSEAKIKPAQLAALVELVEKGAITGKSAKEVFDAMFATGRDPDLIVKEKGLAQITDRSAIAATVDEVLNSSDEKLQKSIADYKKGKEVAFNAIFGAVMKASKGTANREVVTELLKEKLGS
jgi:aspartyl-tRNA(Asn)/glutamyl-tRNA(Gln) amidotransferase subunit B